MKSSPDRLQRLHRGMTELDLDASLIISPANIFYLTGMRVEPFERLICLVIGRDGGVRVVVPELEAENAGGYFDRSELVVWRDGDDPLAAVREALRAAGVSAEAALGLEADRVSVRLGDWLRGEFTEVRFVDLSPLLHSMRAAKDDEEVARIRRACEITAAAFEEILGYLSPGMTELQVAARLDMLLKSGGADGAAYATAVLSGPRAALPHGRSSQKPIASGEVVLIDMGASFGGYCADFTRTVMVGERGWARYAELYRLVAGAQAGAASALRAGTKAGDVDAAARRVIEEGGWGAGFTHRTGHGLGIEIHERPSLAPGSGEVLRSGMVTTLEPGIYVPGWGGVRIEDTVLVGEIGAVTLTEASREPIAV